eukprot:891242_1
MSQSFQRGNLEDVKEFILHVIKHCDAHTTRHIWRCIDIEYQNVTLQELCGKKLKTILNEMKTEQLICHCPKGSKKKWDLVDKDRVINNGEQYRVDNAVFASAWRVIASDKQLKWRQKQIDIAKSSKQYKELRCGYLSAADKSEPK